MSEFEDNMRTAFGAYPSVSLVKDYVDNDDVNERHAWGMDNEAWASTVLLPMYMSVVYPEGWADSTYNALRANDLGALTALLRYERRYNNATGTLVERD